MDSHKKTIVVVTNRISNTVAYYHIDDAHKKAIQDITDKAQAVMDGIQAATPPIRGTMDATAVDIDSAVGHVDSSSAVGHVDGSTDPPLEEQDPDINGEVTDAITNDNTSSSTSPSKDPPGNATRN